MRRTGRFILGGLLGLALGYALALLLLPSPYLRRHARKREEPLKE